MCVTLSSCSSLGRSKRWGGGLVKLRRFNEIWSSEVIYEIRRFGIWVNRLRSKVTREERGHRGGLMSHTQGSGLLREIWGNVVIVICCECSLGLGIILLDLRQFIISCLTGYLLAFQEQVSVTNQKMGNFGNNINRPGTVTANLSIFLDRLLELLRSHGLGQE